VCVEHGEEFSEFIFLAMISVLDEDHFGCASLFSESYEVQEDALGELVNGDVSEPDEESSGLLVEKAGEGPVADLSIKTNLGVEIEQLDSFFGSNHFL